MVFSEVFSFPIYEKKDFKQNSSIKWGHQRMCPDHTYFAAYAN